MVTELKINFPQEDIKLKINDVCTYEYNLNWDVILVIQNRKIRKSSLLNIDYSIPLFELSKKIKININTIGDNLVSILNKDSDFINKYDMEYLDGYLNIMLSDAVLSNLTKMSANWFSKRKINTKVLKKNIFYVPDMTFFNDSSLGSHIPAHNILEDLHKLLKHKYTSHVLLNDLDDSSTNITNFIQIKDKNGSRRISRSASKIAGNTKTSLNRALLNNASESFYGDIKTGALYYSDKFLDLPLRSSTGRLYPFAFVLSRLEKIIESMDPKSENLIVFLPQKYHFALQKFLVNNAKLNKINISFFDARVSRANIESIIKNEKTLGEHFKIAKEILRNYKKSGSDNFTRQEIIYLASLPYELTNFIELYELPRIFDSINQMQDITHKRLLSQEAVQIPTYKHRLNRDLVVD